MEHPDNARLWSFYLADMTIRTLSRHTILNYQQTLKSLDLFLGKAFSDATKLDLMGYVADQQSKVAPRTVHLRFIGLRVFYNWMVREELIAASPMRTIPEPAVDDVEPAVSTDADLKVLLVSVTWTCKHSLDGVVLPCLRFMQGAIGLHGLLMLRRSSG